MFGLIEALLFSPTPIAKPCRFSSQASRVAAHAAAAAFNERLPAPTFSATLKPITAGHVRRYAFPRCSSHEPSHYRSIRRAFESIGCRVVGGREAGRAIVWAPPGKA